MDAGRPLHPAIAKWNWTEVCGPDGFLVWDAGLKDPGLCFSILAVQMPVLAVFSAVSAYFYGKPSGRFVRTTGQLCTIWLRSLVVLLLALLPIAHICFLTIESNKIGGSIDYILYLQAGARAITWFVHLGLCLVLRTRLSPSSRGPGVTNAAWALVFAVDVVLVRSHLLRRHPDDLPSDIEFMAALWTVALQVVYAATLISGLWGPEGLDGAQQAALLTTSGHSYSQFREEADPHYLGVAQDGASCPSRLLFHWVTPLMNKGVAARLTGPEELFDLPPALATRHLAERFGSSLEGSRTLFKALHACYGLQFYSIGILKLLADLAGFACPMLLGGLVTFIENKNEDIRLGLAYAAGLFVATTLAAFCNAHFSFLVSVVGLKIRSSLISTVYNKILKPSLSSLSALNMGAIVNYMSTDTDRIVNSCASFHAFWSIPFQIVVTLYLLYLQVELAFVAGLAFSLILIPINKCLASKIGELSEKLMSSKDERVKSMTEAITGIRVLKYHVWEDHFINKIKKLRSNELKYLKGRKYLDALCVYFWATTPVLISILTFTTYALMGNKLTAAKVFTTIALLNMLIAPLNTFPWVLNGLTEAWVSLKRIQKLICLPNLDHFKYYVQEHEPTTTESDVRVRDAAFVWGHHREDDSAPLMHSKFNLKGLNLDVRKGKLVCIIGPVGCGKSSILNALLAEMDKKSGAVYMANLREGFGYVAQQPWLQRGTIRENILFGETYQQSKYKEVLHACCLDDDLRQLRGGDMVSVGESGSTLSGGQRARVALARAVYQDKQTYLLDDILSAVDPAVARKIFNKCITGLLKDKTRILCTHNRSFLQRANWIVVMENGTIKQQGLPEHVLESCSDILEAGSTSEEAQPKEQLECKQTAGMEHLSVPEVAKEEELETGNIEFSVIKDYWRALGHMTAFAIVLSLVLMQVSRNMSDWWLSYWVTHASHNSTTLRLYTSKSQFDLVGGAGLTAITVDETTFYLSVYGMIGGLNSLFTLFRAFLFAYGGVRAASTLHSKLLKSVLRGKVYFFDLTPAGRLINRFSSDTYTIDDSLPFILNILLAQFFGLVGSLVVTTYGLPWLCLVLVPLLPLYRWLQHYYRLTSRELKRIGSVALSPVYNHFNETLQGLTTIKALGASKRFCHENEVHLENSQKAQFSGMAASQWLGLRLQFFGVVIVGGVGLIAVVQHHYGYGVNPGLVGLAITYALSTTSLLNGVINAFTETEKEMIAVERTRQYVRSIEPEPLTDALPQLAFPWPGQGVVTFNSVEFRHRDNVPLSLSGVTFETHPAEKVGIVGRTGAGKSSIFAALFRLNELSMGQILIDAVDTSKIGLRSLRSRIAIIPQEPFLFSGSLRENIDPLNEYSTPEIMTAIRKCHLEEVAFRLGSIDFKIGDQGQLLSVGQKQLVCLARAVLHNAKILCIDEATANVDEETDQQIQKIIKESFYYSTVLTIAHRVNTVLDCDRVLVMRDGVVVEFDTPDALMQDPESNFSRLNNEKV